MATNTTRSRPRLLAGLAELTDAFDRHGARYALIGGLATGFHARPWLTNAVEILLTAPEASLPGLIADLIDRGFTLDERTVINEFRHRHLTTFEYQGVRIDWLKPVPPAFWHVLDRAVTDERLGQRVCVASAEGLILLKLTTSSTRDIADIESLLRTSQGKLDLTWVEREWLTLFPADDPRWQRFRQLVAEFYEPRPSPACPLTSPAR
jgi:hypothetical protein